MQSKNATPSFSKNETYSFNCCNTETKNKLFIKPIPIKKEPENEPKINLSDSVISCINQDHNNFSNGIKKKINEIYGSANIELWDDNDDVVQKQLSFISNEKLNKATSVLKKDEYDIDYDKGKLKKLKKKKEFRKTNFFQKSQDRSKKIH